MRNMGQTSECVGKFETWIDDNCEELYENEGLFKKFGRNKINKRERDAK